MNTLIKVNSVSKEYKMGTQTVKAANKLDFTINQGELVVILGPSGSGKSTLLNLLGGLDKPTSGEIIIDNENITAFSDKELTHYRAKEIGFIFQFYNLIANLTVFENISLIKSIKKEGLDTSDILEKVGLYDKKDSFPAQLSGGEQQRAAIARALIKSPKILLCDEPTGALDSQNGRNILKLLKDMSVQEGKTIIIITHNAEIAKTADRVIRMKDGRIEEVFENSDPISPEEVKF
jgi:putative ABC transport system ATP-binding protein